MTRLAQYIEAAERLNTRRLNRGDADNNLDHLEVVHVEVVKNQRRRRWFPSEKAALVRRTYDMGMSVSLVAFKRDYVSRMDLSDAETVLAQLPAAFEHCNEVHPHSSLKMLSPREFRQQHTAK